MIRVEKQNESYVRVFSDPSTEQELSQFFTFEVPGARFTPKFKARLWDGKLRLYNLQTKTLYTGLLEYVKAFAKENSIDFESFEEEKTSLDRQTLMGFVNWLNLHGRGEPIQIRDYQVDAIHKAINDNRVLLLSPTASGKSLIIYTLLRYHIEHKRKCIIIVPTTSLVEQLYSDFEDYSYANGWNVEKNCQKLYSGLSKDFPSSRITLYLENGAKVTLAGNENIRMINKSMKLASDLIEGDDIDEKWLEENIHRLQTYE